MPTIDISFVTAAICDLALIITFPLHMRFLYVLLTRHTQTQSERPFYILLTCISTCNSIYILIYIFVIEPAQEDLFESFFISQSYWMGKLYYFEAVILLMMETTCHFLISLNRLTAVAFPIQHRHLWTVNRIRVAIGSLFAIENLVFTLPLTFTFTGSYYYFRAPFGTLGIYFYVTDAIAVVIYQSVAVTIGAVVELCALLIYMIILVKVYNLRLYTKNEQLGPSSNRFVMSALRMAFASFLTSTGNYFLIGLTLMNRLTLAFYGTVLLSNDVYNALFIFGSTMMNISTPWCMTLFVPTVRTLIIGRESPTVSSRPTSTQSTGNVIEVQPIGQHTVSAATSWAMTSATSNPTVSCT